MRAERTQGYELHLHEMDCKPAGDALIATGPERTVPEPYQAYVQVFSEADSESMPSQGPQNLAIKLRDGKEPPWDPI